MDLDGPIRNALIIAKTKIKSDTYDIFTSQFINLSLSVFIPTL